MELPEIHFQSVTLPAPTEDAPEQKISELVEPGQLLASFPSNIEENPSNEEEDKQSESENSPKEMSSARVQYHLEAGEYTEMSEDGNSIIASCYGYPTVITTSKPSGNVSLLVSILPLIKVLDDNMEATLSLFPSLPDTTPPDKDIINAALQQSRILYGVDDKAIDYVLSNVTKSHQPTLDHTIARGKSPIPGKDAYLRFEIEIGPIAGKILSKGTIDFRERRLFVGVKNNQIIGTKIPFTLGIPGTDLSNDAIAAREGKDLLVEVSDDTSFNEKDGTIRATASGILTVVNDKSIRVSAKQQIDGDVDFNTGNIRSQNAVEIKGSIYPDFTVSTKGDLFVGENVQASIINTRGNVVIKGGIIGPGSQVRVKGDGDINYIERGQLIAGGNVVIRSTGYYSDIQVSGDLHCPEKVKLVGGTILVGGSITVGQIGSNSSEPTSVAVGTDINRYKRYKELQGEYQQLIDDMQSWYNRHGKGKNKGKKIEHVLAEISEIEQELTTLNLIPDSKKHSLSDGQSFYSDASILVYGLLAARTKIRIGNDTIVLDKDIVHTRVSMDIASGKIVFTSI